LLLLFAVLRACRRYFFDGRELNMDMGHWCNEHRDRGNTKSSSCPGPVPVYPPQFVHGVMEF
jgi:hypothetical protein